MKSPVIPTTDVPCEEDAPHNSKESRAALLELVKQSAPTAIGNAVSDKGRKELEARMFNRPSCQPPINNAIVPDIFDKLDAQARERTRVMNSVLKQRLTVQESVIRRHRVLSEKFHSREQAKVKGELKMIEKCLPSFVAIYKDTNVGSLKNKRNSMVHVSKQLPTLPSESHFCYRYFDHHNPAKIAQKISNDIRRSMEAADRTVRQLMADSESRNSFRGQPNHTNVQSSRRASNVNLNQVAENEALQRRSNGDLKAELIHKIEDIVEVEQT